MDKVQNGNEKGERHNKTMYKQIEEQLILITRILVQDVCQR